MHARALNALPINVVCVPSRSYYRAKVATASESGILN